METCKVETCKIETCQIDTCKILRTISKRCLQCQQLKC